MSIRTSYPPYGRIVIYPYQSRLLVEKEYIDDTDKTITWQNIGQQWSLDEDIYSGSVRKLVKGEPDGDAEEELSRYVDLTDTDYLIGSWYYSNPKKRAYWGTWYFRIWYKSSVDVNLQHFKIKVYMNGSYKFTVDSGSHSSTTTYSVIDWYVDIGTTYYAGSSLKIYLYVWNDGYDDYTVYVRYGSSTYDSHFRFPPDYFEVYSSPITTDVTLPACETQLHSTLNATLDSSSADLLLYLDDTKISEVTGWSPSTYGTLEDVVVSDYIPMSDTGTLKMRSRFYRGVTLTTGYWKYSRWNRYVKNPFTPRDVGKEILFLWKAVLPPKSGVKLNSESEEVLWNDSDTTTEYVDFSDSPFLLKVDRVEITKGNPILYFLGR